MPEEAETKATAQEQAETDKLGSFYKPTPSTQTQGRGSFFARRKRSLIIAAIVGSLGLGYGGFLIFSGPFQLIHFAEVFKNHNFGPWEDTESDRLGKIVKYVRFRHDPANRRLTAVQRRFANATEKALAKKGYEPIYSERTGDIEGWRKNGQIIEDYEGRSQAERRAGNKRILGADEANISGIVKKTVYDLTLRTKGAINFRFFENTQRRGRDLRAAIINKLKSIVGFGSPEVVKANVNEDPNATDEDRNKANEALGEGQSQVDDIAAEVENGRAAGQSTPDAVDAAAAKTKPGVGGKSLLGASAFMIGCMLQSYADKGLEIAYDTRYLPLMRLSNVYIAGADQAKAGQELNAGEYGALTEQLNSKDNSWINSAAYRRAVGESDKGYADLPDDAWPDGSGFQRLFASFKKSIDFVLPDAVCNVAQSVIGQIFFFVVDLATLGATRVIGIIAQSTFDAIYDDIVRSLVDSSVTGEETGPLLANAVDAGLNISINEQARAMGGRPLSAQEAAELRDNYEATLALERSRQSWTYKLFSPQNPQSLLAKMAIRIPRTSEGILDKLAQIPSNLTSSLGAVMSIPRAQAVGGFHNYGITQYGFSKSELNKATYEDPIANFAWVETNIIDSTDQAIKDLQKKWDECFELTVLELDDDEFNYCDDKGEAFTRYRFYRLDKSLLEGLECLVDTTSTCGLPTENITETDAGSLNNIGGDCQALQKLILNKDHVTFESQNPVNDIKNCVAKDQLLILLSEIAEHKPLFNVRISVIKTGHSACTANGSTSNHFNGIAVDIGNEEIAKRLLPWLYDNRGALKLDELIFDPMPPGTKTLDGGQADSYGSDTLAAHKNHIHISVLGTKQSAGCPND